MRMTFKNLTQKLRGRSGENLSNFAKIIKFWILSDSSTKDSLVFEYPIKFKKFVLFFL